MLARMGTPRSLVLCQLIQEEAQKQCAEILLPKNVCTGFAISFIHCNGNGERGGSYHKCLELHIFILSSYF